MENTENVTKLVPKGKTPPAAAPKQQTAAPSWETMTATERLDVLRDGQAVLFEQLHMTLDQIQGLKTHITEIYKKIHAIVKISEDGKSVSNATLKETVEEYNVDALKKKTKELLDAGLMQPSEVSTLNSFVAGRLIGKDGNVISPRTQVMVNQVAGDDLQCVLNKKVGDKTTLAGGSTFIVEEVYEITNLAETPEAIEEQPQA
jgi:hypothetical protein